MDAPDDLVRIVGGLRYAVASSTLIAHNCYWDGHNFERNGRNTYLYRTAGGRFFTVHVSQWEGERTRLEPTAPDVAVALYEEALQEHVVEYDLAFPGVKVEEA